MSKSRLIIFALIVVISGAVYLATLCPTVEFIDSGELALVAKNLGVAHPTGYPLYTILGRLAAILIPGSLIFRVNFLSLLFTSFATGFAYLLFSEIAKGFITGIWREIVAASASLFLAFSPIWWSQGTTNEVYSLNLLLMPVSIWALLKWDLGRQAAKTWLFLSAYLLGLCLTNHLSAIYLLPGFLIVIIPGLWNHPRPKRAALITVLLFVFPATLYLFLPIRAGYHPFLNWGSADDPYFFYKHITGWQYRIWMFEKPLEIFKSLGTKLSPSIGLLNGQFGWLGAIIVTIGLAAAISRLKKIFLFGMTVSVINLIYVMNYEIGDIESYYLPIILMAGIFMVSGLAFSISLAYKRWGWSGPIKSAAIAVLTILPAYSLIGNYDISDRSQKTYARQGVFDLTASMETNGLALVENWDFYSPWLYFYFEEQHRPGTVLLDKELMRRSWYIDFIKRFHPEIYHRSRPEFEDFLRRIEAFERNRPYDPVTLDRAFYNMLQAIIHNEGALRPVYTNIINDPKLLANSAPIPDGILYRIGTADRFYQRPLYEFNYNFWANNLAHKDKRVAYLLSFYLRAFESRQKYCAYFAMHDEEEYYRRTVAQVKAIIGEI